MTSKSLTGTWGSSTFGPPPACSLPQTTTRECYDMAPKFLAAEMEKNKFAKFTTLKNAGQLVLQPQNTSPPKTVDDGSNSDRYLTTQQVSYGVGGGKIGECRGHPLVDGQILAATGRSGARQERGLQGSGLTGEALNTSSEPSKNSFVQRMWMYQDDSALYHRQNGVPEAKTFEGLSFPIGEQDPAAASTKKSKMRASTDLMFSSIKKTGYKIFQDDEQGETANLEYHYKC